MTEREVSSERVSDASWLEAAAIYFENRPTNGEDASHWANVANAERCRSIALALRSSVKTVGVDVADTCDGVEQAAFEAWAKAAGHDMHEHPMHYLFLDPKTDAARMGWKAGITHARQRILAAIEAPVTSIEVTEGQVDRFRAFVKEATGTELSTQVVERALTAALKGGE